MSSKHARVNTSQGFSTAPVVAVCILAFLACALVFAGILFFAGHQQPSSDKAASVPDASAAASSAQASDDALNVEDFVMTLGGSKDTYVLVGESYLEAGCHAVSVNDGDVTPSVSIDGTVDTSTPGTYEVSYTATDSTGAKSVATRTVHVVDSFDSGEATSVPVLMYHYVYTEANPPEHLDNNYILDTKLATQCAYLQEEGYYYPSFQELASFVVGEHSLPAKSVILTFDDGEAGFLQYGVPILNEYEVPATSFIVCSDADAKDRILSNASEYVQFQSHSFDMHHGNSGIGQGGIIHAMSESEIAQDIAKSQEILGTTEAVAYPYGDNNGAAWAALTDQGVLCAFTVANDRISPGDNPMALNRVRISGDYEFDGFKWCVRPV